MHRTSLRCRLGDTRPAALRVGAHFPLPAATCVIAFINAERGSPASCTGPLPDPAVAAIWVGLGWDPAAKSVTPVGEGDEGACPWQPPGGDWVGGPGESEYDLRPPVPLGSCSCCRDCCSCCGDWVDLVPGGCSCCRDWAPAAGPGAAAATDGSVHA